MRKSLKDRVRLLGWNAMKDTNATASLASKPTKSMCSGTNVERDTDTSVHRQGCLKMSLCGTVDQTKTIAFRVVDNKKKKRGRCRGVDVFGHLGQKDYFFIFFAAFRFEETQSCNAYVTFLLTVRLFSIREQLALRCYCTLNGDWDRGFWCAMADSLARFVRFRASHFRRLDSAGG